MDSPKYQKRVRGEIEQLRQTEGGAESILRLECMLGGTVQASDGFRIERLSAADGQVLNVSTWQAARPAHAVVYVNGLESHGGWFSDVARELACRNVCVYALDRRGSGLNTRIRGTHRDWINDLALTVDLAVRECPRAGVHVASLCFGAAVATALALQRPRAVESLIYMSPGLQVRVHPTAFEMLRIALSRLPGFACNIHSPIRTDEMFADSGGALWFLYRDKLRTVSPTAEDFLEARRILQYVLRHVSEVSIPSIVFLAGKDRVVDNAAARKVFLRFGRRPHVIEYPDSQHIIFFGPARERLAADILDFIYER